MNAKTILASALAAALGASSTAIADNLTVAQGETETLTAGATYDAIVVNGTLAIPAGTSVSASSLVVATNITGDATVTLAPGASLTLTGDVHLGYDGGQARLNVGTGASLNVGGDLYMAYGHTASPASNAEPTRAYLTVSTNATVKIEGSYGLYFFQSQYWPSGTTERATSVDTVRLENGAILDCKQIRRDGPNGSFNNQRSCTIVFAGGAVSAGTASKPVVLIARNAANTWLNFESENGNPIRLKANSKCSSWFALGSASSRAKISGTGDLVLESQHNFAWTSDSWDVTKPNVSFSSSGRIRLVGDGCGISSYKTNAFSTVNGGQLRSLVLEKGAAFDMKGLDAEFNSVYGTLSNSTETPGILTIGGDGSDLTYSQVLPPGVTLAKKGAGNLTLFAGAARDLSVDGGTLKLMGRAEIGYPFYKFNVYGTENTGNANHQVKISEFKFLNGDTDVTQGWNDYYYVNRDTSYYNEPTNMWDGNLNTQFYDQRDQNWTTVSNIHATLEYYPARKVTGYTWYTTIDWNGRLNVHPTNWAVFGSADNKAWEQLDLVDGFAFASHPGTKAWCQTNFVCTYAPTVAAIDSLTMASGTALAVDGAEVSVSSATAASAVPLSLSHGASLTLPAAIQVESLAIDLGQERSSLPVLNPAAGGALYVTGDSQSIKGDLLNVGSCANASNLSSWSVYLNGISLDRTLGVQDGALRLVPEATVILMR